MLQGKLVSGADAMNARASLEISTRGGAGCLGRVGEIGELSVGAAADVAVWKLQGPAFAGVLDDPVEGWLRCGPTSAWHTLVRGKLVVKNGELESPELQTMLQQHKMIARRFQPQY